MSEALIVAGAAALTAILIVLLKPWLLRYALARPNARSSHLTPTPQGGGIAVIAAWLDCLALRPRRDRPLVGAIAPGLLAIFGATILIAILGAIDDIRHRSGRAAPADPVSCRSRS